MKSPNLSLALLFIIVIAWAIKTGRLNKIISAVFGN